MCQDKRGISAVQLAAMLGMAYFGRALLDRLALAVALSRSADQADGIKYLTVPEMKLVLARPDPSKKAGLRDRFFMYPLYGNGCQIQKILDLTIKNFSVNSGGARLHIIGKGNKFEPRQFQKK